MPIPNAAVRAGGRRISAHYKRPVKVTVADAPVPQTNVQMALEGNVTQDVEAIVDQVIKPTTSPAPPAPSVVHPPPKQQSSQIVHHKRKGIQQQPGGAHNCNSYA